MKTDILQKSAAVCIGMAFALSAVVARADEPKKDDTATTTTRKHVAAKATHDANPADKKATTVIPTEDGRSAHYVSGGVVGGANGQEHAVLTGSQLPRTYDRRAYSTDSRDSEFILDKNDQRLRQTNTVQDALRSVPGINVGGMR